MKEEYKKGDKVIYRNRIKTICNIFINPTTKKEIIILIGGIYTSRDHISPYNEITLTKENTKEVLK